MGIVDSLNEGFELQANSDGEWVPYKGTYKVGCVALRPELDEQYGKYYQAEWNILEVLEGDMKRESRFSDFRRRYYVEGERAKENFRKLCNDFFTMGVEFDRSSDEAFDQSLGNAIHAQGYLRAWGWTKEGTDKMQQSFVIQKEKVAEKKRTAHSVGF